MRIGRQIGLAFRFDIRSILACHFRVLELGVGFAALLEMLECSRLAVESLPCHPLLTHPVTHSIIHPRTLPTRTIYILVSGLPCRENSESEPYAPTTSLHCRCFLWTSCMADLNGMFSLFCESVCISGMVLLGLVCALTIG